MAVNRDVNNIPFIPFPSNPGAKFIFIGIYPSPRTATMVEICGGNSVFTNEIFEMRGQAGLSEGLIYMADLCKRHWGTSSGGKPWQGKEDR